MESRTQPEATHVMLHPCAAELYVFIFPLFKAGIANAISSFKRRKIFIFM